MRRSAWCEQCDDQVDTPDLREWLDWWNNHYWRCDGANRAMVDHRMVEVEP